MGIYAIAAFRFLLTHTRHRIPYREMSIEWLSPSCSMTLSPHCQASMFTRAPRRTRAKDGSWWNLLPPLRVPLRDLRSRMSYE